MKRQLLTLLSMSGLITASLGAPGPAHALHTDDHDLDIAAWEINGEPVENREADLTTETSGSTVEPGDRVTYLTRVVDQDGALEITLNFNSPGHAYVLGSAVGGTCGEPTEAAPGIFDLTCTVEVNDEGTGDLLTTFEATAETTRECDTGEAEFVTMIVGEPVGAASDLELCLAAAAEPSPTPTPTPQPTQEATVPDTAMPPMGMTNAPLAAFIFAALLGLSAVAVLARRRH